MCNVAVRTILHCVDGGEPFDWASYLMEGIEFPTYSDTDSEVRRPVTHTVVLGGTRATVKDSHLSGAGWYKGHG